MYTEKYPIRIFYRDKVWQLPVRIERNGTWYKISVDIEGIEVCFTRDEHDGLVPLNHQDNFDPQFLYLIGKGVLEQRQSYCI